MDRTQKLKELITFLDENFSNNELLKYIGTGNPNADILIIGKESSIDDKDSKQYKLELENNFQSWKSKEKFKQKDISNFYSWDDYDPIYPYKGQKYMIDNGSNNGTSRTWYTYQKLINYVFDTPNNSEIDFHKKVFITEVNSSPSRKTKDADISSINVRKDLILKSEFFQSFPVVIISGVGYFKITANSNQIEDTFKVMFKEMKLAGDKQSQPYWIHSNKFNHPSKLLINTYQLSIRITDILLQEIASVIKKEIEL